MSDTHEGHLYSVLLHAPRLQSILRSHSSVNNRYECHGLSMAEVTMTIEKSKERILTTSRSFIFRLIFVRHWVSTTLAATEKNESDFGIREGIRRAHHKQT